MVCQGLKIFSFQYKTRTVLCQVEECMSESTSVKAEGGAGHPSTFTTDVKIKQAREMVMVNRWVIIDEEVCSLQITYDSAYKVIHDELRFPEDGC